MESFINVPTDEKPIMDAFMKILKTKKIDPEHSNQYFLRTFYDFYRAGWTERHKRTDISINAYHQKFVGTYK